MNTKTNSEMPAPCMCQRDYATTLDGTPLGNRLAPYRNEIARLCELLDERDATIREILEENERTKAAYAERIAEAESRTSPCDLQSGICVHAAEAMQLRDEVARLQKELDGLDGRVRRYENATTPGRHGYNEARASVRAEEERMHAAEEGREVVENHTIGPPLGHAGQQSEIEPMRTKKHEYERCPRCKGRHIRMRKEHSKIVVDFDGEYRDMIVTLHTGHAIRCDTCCSTFKPKFPSIQGTSFGITALCHILEYAGKKNTDKDIAEYMANLYKHKCTPNCILNARKAIARVLEHTTRRIIEELSKAPYLMIDETTYRYKKKQIYVWVIRTDTTTIVVPSMGRGELNAPGFLKPLKHIPVVVDGYAVYPNMFAVIQRCWAHVLLKSEEAYIRCKNTALKKIYMELYHRLRNIHRKAKRVAESTAPMGGAGTDVCLQLQREVEPIIAAYGNDGFATHLRNALPNLFTFLRYPGMPSTNNATERDIRDAVVVQRRFRHKFASPTGMWVFSILHSFISTCKKMRVVPMHMFNKVVTQSGFDVVSYGLSVLNPKALPVPPKHIGVETELECPIKPDAGDTRRTKVSQGGTKPPDGTTYTAPQPTTRPLSIPDDNMAIVCIIILACFRADDMNRSYDVQFDKGPTHTLHAYAAYRQCPPMFTWSIRVTGYH